MAVRILQILLLLVISSEAVAQLPLPSRPPQPPPIAPPASTQLSTPDRREVLIAAAAYMRDEAKRVRSLAGGDSIVLDPRYHPLGTVDHIRNRNHSHVDMPAEELQLFQRELRAGTGTLESLQNNCRPLFGCELIVPHYIMFGQPVLRTDEMVTISVEHTYRGGRYPSGNIRPLVASGFELLLKRTDRGWTVTANYSRYIT